MIYEYVVVTPSIPITTERHHPAIQILGRGDRQHVVGWLIYRGGITNGHEPGYRFKPEGRFITQESLEQIVLKTKAANDAIRGGLL